MGNSVSHSLCVLNLGNARLDNLHTPLGDRLPGILSYVKVSDSDVVAFLEACREQEGSGFTQAGLDTSMRELGYRVIAAFNNEGEDVLKGVHTRKMAMGIAVYVKEDLAPSVSVSPFQMADYEYREDGSPLRFPSYGLLLETPKKIVAIVQAPLFDSKRNTAGLIAASRATREHGKSWAVVGDLNLIPPNKGTLPTILEMFPDVEVTMTGMFGGYRSDQLPADAEVIASYAVGDKKVAVGAELDGIIQPKDDPAPLRVTKTYIGCDVKTPQEFADHLAALTDAEDKARLSDHPIVHLEF